jgi:transposase
MELARSKKSYSPEFREEAVKLVIETSRPIAQVAKEPGIVVGGPLVGSVASCSAR